MDPDRGRQRQRRGTRRHRPTPRRQARDDELHSLQRQRRSRIQPPFPGARRGHGPPVVPAWHRHPAAPVGGPGCRWGLWSVAGTFARTSNPSRCTRSSQGLLARRHRRGPRQAAGSGAATRRTEPHWASNQSAPYRASIQGSAICTRALAVVVVVTGVAVTGRAGHAPPRCPLGRDPRPLSSAAAGRVRRAAASVRSVRSEPARMVGALSRLALSGIRLGSKDLVDLVRAVRQWSRWRGIIEPLIGLVAGDYQIGFTPGKVPAIAELPYPTSDRPTR